MFAKLLREPLLHFLLLGALIFLVFGERAANDASAVATPIVVTAADVERLAGYFERTWHRPPSQDEIHAAVDDYIREEVLYRAALSLGLDKNDSIVRRRLRQKMEFLFEDTMQEPQESELRAYYEAHQAKFRVEPLISFRQVFLSSRRGDAAAADARQILLRVAAGADAQHEGDPSLLGDHFERMAQSQVGALFGDAFARQLADVGGARWIGPLSSAYGLHIVRVSAIEPARVPPFEAVKDAVKREWSSERRSSVLKEQYEKFRARYQVTVQYPPAVRP